mgnify:CR=1 FL=1
MERIHEGYECKDFEMPSSIEKKTICAKTGKLASSEACSAYTELFCTGNCSYSRVVLDTVVEKPDTDANSSDTSGETDDTTDNNSGTTTPPSD